MHGQQNIKNIGVLNISLIVVNCKLFRSQIIACGIKKCCEKHQPNQTSYPGKYKGTHHKKVL